MIVCTRCGFQNDDSDTFCGSCAGFLEWSGEKVAEEVAEPPLPDAEPEVEEVHAGLIERIRDRIGIGEDKGEELSEEAAVGETANSGPVGVPACPEVVGAKEVSLAAAEPATVAAGDAEPSTVEEVPAGEMSPTVHQTADRDPAPALPEVPPPLPARSSPSAAQLPAGQPTTVRPGAAQPEAVKPAAVKARPIPRAKAAPSRVINPGDLVCGQCGEGNDPARHFCRRCGASLQQAIVFTPRWYQRLIHRLRRRKVRAAGERPRVRRRAFGGGGWVSKWVTRAVALAIAAFVILTFVGPVHHQIRHQLSSWYHDVAGYVHPTYNVVHPVSASATSAAPGHPAGFAIDNLSNTCWEAGGSQSGVGQSITITLQQVTNIDKIGFINGDNDTSQSYLTEPRPKKVVVTFAALTPYSKTLTLRDTPSFQTFTVHAEKARSITVTIESVYASAQGQSAAITEIELFSKS